MRNYSQKGFVVIPILILLGAITFGAVTMLSRDTSENLGAGSNTISSLPVYINSKDEGSSLTTRTTSFDFVGSGVTATNTGNAVTVTIPGGGGGGSSIILDLADNGVNESTGITEIATSNDTNGIFSEPSADKLLINAGLDWPKADVADTVTVVNTGGDTTSFIPIFDSDTGNLAIKTDSNLKWNATSNILEIDGPAQIGGNARPVTNDGGALGTSSFAWSDLFLASGSIIDWNAADLTLTHSLNTLTLAGGTLVLPSSGLQIGSSNPFSDSAGTLTLQNVDAIDATTKTTLEGAIDIAGDVTGTGLGSVVVAANAVALTTDTTGNYVSSATASGGLTLTGTEGASLGILLPAATDALSATTSSGSGLQLLSAGLTLLQGCSDAQILKWVEATDTWDCAADGGGGGSGDIEAVGDVASGAAFNGTQGTILTFNDIDGDKTLEYDNTNNWFEFNATLNPAANDGAALGNTTQQWSDLFLAEGGVLNWDNGDATMTQTGNDVTFAGISTFGVGTSTAVTLGTIELGAASDTTIARSAAGAATLEGVAIDTASNTLTLSNKTIPASSNVLDACVPVAVTDEYSDLTTGTAKATFRMPFAMTVTSVRASLVTVATGGTLVTVDINEAGTTILSTKLTFDASEKTTTTAATAAVVSDSSLADDAEMTVDIDAVGNTTPGNGLKISICGTI